MDVSDGEQHSQEEPSATTGKEPKTSKSGNSVHSGPNKNITDSVKDSPFSNQTTDSSNVNARARNPVLNDVTGITMLRGVT